MFVHTLVIFLSLRLAASQSQCPPQYSFNSISSKCYRVYDNQSLTFIAASGQCVKDGGQLASVHNAFENAFLSNLFTDNSQDHWIGLTTMLTGASWGWLDGTNVDYTRWTTEQPVADPAGSCASMLAGDGTWTAGDCSVELAFTCETNTVVKTTTSTTTTTTTKPKRPVCDNGWVYFDHTTFCYYFGEAKQQQYDAANHCTINDAFLASVHDAEENDFIYSNGGTGTIWLGSHRTSLQKGCDNCFANDDGTAFNYWNWAKGEPNDKDNKELCVQMYGAKAKEPSYWNDEQCSEESDHFVCKKSPTWV